MPRYLRALSDDIILARPMKVAVLTAGGPMAGLAAALLEELGCQAVPVEGQPDLADPATLAPLSEAVGARGWTWAWRSTARATGWRRWTPPAWPKAPTGC
ncbi:hypothetical protein HML84_13340 [Alcanivorax sp. IO_7]|nr:hypothetical protein HML84_13340 [Alcanivorax sp. IO_7]